MTTNGQIAARQTDNLSLPELAGNGAALTVAESTTLSEHEATIERGLKTFYEVGAALCAIRDAKLYRQSHDTFETYCRERWDMSKTHANRLVDASAVVQSLTPIGVKPANEAQARALRAVPEKDRQEVWGRVVEEAPANAAGRPAITAAMIEGAAKAIDWERMSELEQNERQLLAMFRRPGQPHVPASPEKQYVADRLQEKLEAKADEALEEEKREREKEEREDQEWTRIINLRVQRRREVAPSFRNIKETKQLRQAILEILREKATYAFSMPRSEEDEYHDYQTIKASWPIKYSHVAADILESIAKTLRDAPCELLTKQPENPWQCDEKREPILYGPDEVKYIRPKSEAAQ